MAQLNPAIAFSKLIGDSRSAGELQLLLPHSETRQETNLRLAGSGLIKKTS